MAPEVCDTTQYTEHCDIYSWAIVFWQLLSKQTMPYDEKINSYCKKFFFFLENNIQMIDFLFQLLCYEFLLKNFVHRN